MREKERKEGKRERERKKENEKEREVLTFSFLLHLKYSSSVVCGKEGKLLRESNWIGRRIVSMSMDLESPLPPPCPPCSLSHQPVRERERRKMY